MSSIERRLGRELGSFYALLVINIAAGAVAMGLSMSYGVQYILAAVKALPAIGWLDGLPLAVIAFAVFGIAIGWLISSAEVFSEAQEIRDEFEKGGNVEDQSPTSMIVKTMALYREKKSTIGRMALVSRLAGILLILAGAYSLAGPVIYGMSGEPWMIVAAIAMNLGIGALALYIPHIFSNFSKAWDLRLAKGEEAEVALRRVLEGKS